MSKILGVDASSQVLACALVASDFGSADLIATTSIKPSGGWPIERRLKYIDDELGHLLSFKEHGSWSADIMAVEQPWNIVGRMSANNALWRTLGHCECIANRLGMDFQIVRVCDWRRSSGLKAKKRDDLKDEAVKMVEVLFREKGKKGPTLPEDEAEAVLIARHAALTMR